MPRPERRKDKFTVSLDIELVAWAKEEAWRRRVSFSTFLDQLIESEKRKDQEPEKPKG